MLIDCATCPASPERAARFNGRGPDHCADCVVTIMRVLPPSPVAVDSGDGDWSGEGFGPWRDEVVDLDLDEGEWAAVGLFVRAGLVTRESARLLRAFADEPNRLRVVPQGLTG